MTSDTPEPKAGGRWVWVPDGYKLTKINAQATRDYQREYMRKRRAQARPLGKPEWESR